MWLIYFKFSDYTKTGEDISHENFGQYKYIFVFLFCFVKIIMIIKKKQQNQTQTNKKPGSQSSFQMKNHNI